MPLVVDALAAVRLARLAADDELTSALRAEVVHAAATPGVRPMVGAVAGFVMRVLPCPWCLGVWAALTVVTARSVSPRAGGALVRSLAVAEIVGRVRSHELGRGASRT